MATTLIVTRQAQSVVWMAISIKWMGIAHGHRSAASWRSPNSTVASDELLSCTAVYVHISGDTTGEMVIKERGETLIDCHES